MTMSTSVNKVVAQGNGATTAFNYSFLMPAAANAVVTITDAFGNPTVLQLSQYSLSGVGSSNGGTLNYPLTGSPLAVGTTITLQRILPFQQLTSLVNQAGYFPSVVEGALDQLEMQIQQLAAMTAGNTSLQFPAGDSQQLNAILPSALARANGLVSFDSLGNVIVVAAASGSATQLTLDLASATLATKGAGQIGFSYALGYTAGTVGAWLKGLATSAGAGFIGFIQAAAGAILRTVQSKLSDNVSVLDFAANGISGAAVDPTGVLDSTAGIIAALAASKSVTMPPGTYKTSAPISVPAEHSLIGAGKGITIFKPTGVYAACVQAVGSSYANWLDSVVVGGFDIDGSAFTGTGMIVKYVGLRSRFFDLYIHSVTGKGLYTEGSFDHNFERIEVRGCTGLGIHNYEKQVGTDGVYEETSKLIWTDCWSLENNSAGTQWQVDGGDTFSFNECKPSEGSCGIDFTRNCFGHKIRNLMFDCPSAGTGIAIRTSAQYVQYLYIDGVQTYQSQYDVQVVRGQNIHIAHANTVRVEASADGAVYLGENVPYTDGGSPQKTYPRNYTSTYTPAFNGSGSVVGNGTLTGSSTRNGKVVTVNVLLTVGSTTVFGAGSGFSLPLPAATQSPLTLVAYHTSSATYYSMQCVGAGSAISCASGANYLNATTPFTWAAGDTLSICGTYTTL